MVYILLALGAALFTSLTTIFTKIGIKDVKSNFATFFRTGIVILCSLAICLITNSFASIETITWQNYLFLGLSGIATGLSWLSYNKALKQGDVNKVVAIDKSSFVLTTGLFLIFFFDDTTNSGDPLTISMLILSTFLMLSGTLLMIGKKDVNGNTNSKYLIYAILSAVFASLVSLFVKLGLKGIPSSVGTLFRTIIVFIFAFLICLFKKDFKHEEKISAKSWIFLTLSGIATGASWLLEYEALNYEGANPVVVNSIGKLSILLTMAFSFFVLKEKFSKLSLLGLILLVSGIVVVIIFGL